MSGNPVARRRSRGLRKCALFRRGDCAYCQIEGDSEHKCNACKGNADTSGSKAPHKMDNNDRSL